MYSSMLIKNKAANYLTQRGVIAPLYVSDRAFLLRGVKYNTPNAS
jgi:hypothetical protein